MNLLELLGYILFLELEIGFISAQLVPNANNTLQPQPQSNITWVKVVTFDPKSEPSCKNCTNSDYDEPSPNQRRKRRKRRRYKKPISDRYDRKWSQRRPSFETSHKKYSTRVRLDRPVQFLSDFNPEENLIPLSEPDLNPIRVKTTPPPMIIKTILPPVKFLQPPYVDQYFTGNAATSHSSRKKPSQFVLPPNRGATKFKNTVNYKDDGLDLVDNEIPYFTTPLVQSKPASPKPFKPIVVFPTLPPISQTSSNASQNFLAPEVAKAGMKVVNMNAELLPELESSHPKQEFQSLQPYSQLQERPSTTTNRAEEVQYHWNDRSRGQSPATPFQQQQDGNQRSLVQKSEEFWQPQTQATPSYKPRPTGRTQETTVSRDAEPRYNQLPQENYRSVTRQVITPTTSVPTTNFTTVATTKQSSFKGLELAESNYFSGLPSEEEVSSLVQNDGEVIPGTAGKDYPIFSQSLLQRRRFACRGLVGYFADISSRCQVFYICNGNGAGEPMLCPNGTLFSQELLVCDWWYNVDC